jgi:hypothetical protein
MKNPNVPICDFIKYKTNEIVLKINQTAQFLIKRWSGY